MTKDLENIGARIKRARQKKQLSQADLAELLKVSVAHVSDIERGKTNCSLSILKGISEVLNVSADWLLMIDSESAHVQASAEILELFKDCNQCECEIILNTIKSLKASLMKFRSSEN